jgi:hypothetical protein
MLLYFNLCCNYFGNSNTTIVLDQDARVGLVELACEGDTHAIAALLEGPM